VTQDPVFAPRGVCAGSGLGGPAGVGDDGAGFRSGRTDDLGRCLRLGLAEDDCLGPAIGDEGEADQALRLGRHAPERGERLLDLDGVLPEVA